MRSRIAVLASGGGSNLQAILEYFASQGNARSADIAVVISDRSGAFVLERAQKSNVETLVLSHSEDEQLEQELVSRNIDIIVLAGYLRLLPGRVTSRYRRKIINVHPGPLPEFGGRGMYGERVHAAVLEAGIAETAVTVHLVDEQYDNGAILAQWPVPVVDGDTPASLSNRVLQVEHILYPRVIDIVVALQQANTIR